MFDWRATRGERLEALPGDELVPGAWGSSTHAITCRALAKDMWPWLIQMGCDRAGYYSHDWLDNGGRASADQILPQFQDTKVGDILPFRPGCATGFEVLRMEPERVLLLGAFLPGPGLNTLPWDGERPRAYIRFTWLFLLREREGKTRLVVRARGTVRPGWLTVALNPVAMPAHVVMQRKQLLNLRRRADGRSPLARDNR